MSGTSTEAGDQPAVSDVQLGETDASGALVDFVALQRAPGSDVATMARVPGPTLAAAAAALVGAPATWLPQVSTVPDASVGNLGDLIPVGTGGDVYQKVQQTPTTRAWVFYANIRGASGKSASFSATAPTGTANEGDTVVAGDTGHIWEYAAAQGGWFDTGVVLTAPALQAFASAAAASAVSATSAANSAQSAATQTALLGSIGMPYITPSGTVVAASVTFPNSTQLIPFMAASGRALQVLTDGTIEQVISRPEAAAGVSTAVAAEAAARTAVVDTTMPYITSTGLKIVASVTFPNSSLLAPFMADSGRLVNNKADGSQELVPLQSEISTLVSTGIATATQGTLVPAAPPLPDGDLPVSETVNGSNQIVFARGASGSIWYDHPRGLNKVRTTWDKGETFLPQSYSGTLNGLASGIMVRRNVKRLRVILMFGQSLALGFNQTNDALLTTTSLFGATKDGFASQYFMFNYPIGGTTKVQTVPAIGLVPGMENLLIGSCRESAASSMANHLISRLNAADPNDPQYFLVANCAVGGTAIENLRLGSLMGQNVQQAVSDAIRLGRAAGFDEIVVDYVWSNFGQADAEEIANNTGNFRAWYGGAMIQMMEQYDRFIRSMTGQQQRVRFITEILDYLVRPSLGASSFDQPIFQAITDLRGYPNHFIAGPGYADPRDESRPDRLHKAGVGYNRGGIQASDVMFRIEEGTGFLDFGIIQRSRQWYSTTTFSLQSTPQVGATPAVDTGNALVNVSGNNPLGAGNDVDHPDANNCVYTGATAPIAGYLGCVIADGSSNPPVITAIDPTSLGNGRILFTLSAPLAGPGDGMIGIATTRSPGYTLTTHADGNAVGSRSAICEAGMPIQSLNEPGFQFKRWLTPTIENIGRP